MELPRGSQGLFLVQRIRDEAHRFAITAHRKRRTRQKFVSRLDQIPGVGKKRKKALLQKFGSLDGVKKADITDLTEIQGINEDLARSILTTLTES